MSSESPFTLGRPDEPIKVGLVLQVGSKSPPKLLRITHVFSKCIYLMPVSTPEMARYAVRPRRHARDIAERHIAQGLWRVGRIRLPQEFLISLPQDGEERTLVENTYSAIKPLIEWFDDERNLARAHFTVAIERRASELEISPVTLRRLLLRYYYFGRNKSSLLPLRAGRPVGPQRPAAANDAAGSVPLKRRGRQPIEAATLGANTFVATDDDVADMVACLESLASRGRVTQVAAHETYVKEYFSIRHPKRYADYLAHRCPLPVTLRQYRSITNANASLSRDLQKNVAGHRRRASKGALLATGPGEIYEIDATGGRIFVVDSKAPSQVLGTPIIYLMIDRWSRFIVSAYITLRPASWEEIRYALLIAFTPRKRRFRNLGVIVDDSRWPQGRVCARLVMDRGSEMISRAMLDAAVDGLHIEAEVLPPLCPDGKGIIERLIRELKRKMSQRRIKGSFADRPLDPKTKRSFRGAQIAAVHSLREIYWALIDLVDAHNNSPHKTLEARSILRRARVRPTPREAYVWGLKNITGIECPPLDDADYERLLLGNDKATIGNGSLLYRGRSYLPMNAAAERQARLSTSRRRSIAVKIDRSNPSELYAPNGDDNWPHWTISAAGLDDLQETTLEEEDCLADAHKLLIAQTRNDAFIDGQLRAGKHASRKISPKHPSQKYASANIRARRAAETADIKQALSSKNAARKTPAASAEVSRLTSPSQPTWREIEQRERLESIERQRKARK